MESRESDLETDLFGHSLSLVRQDDRIAVAAVLVAGVLAQLNLLEMSNPIFTIDVQ